MALRNVVHERQYCRDPDVIWRERIRCYVEGVEMVRVSWFIVMIHTALRHARHGYATVRRRPPVATPVATIHALRHIRRHAYNVVAMPVCLPLRVFMQRFARLCRHPFLRHVATSH